MSIWVFRISVWLKVGESGVMRILESKVIGTKYFGLLFLSIKKPFVITTFVTMSKNIV